MILSKEKIAESNKEYLSSHKKKYEFISGEIDNSEEVVKKLAAFQIAIPSWALSTGGTRFGRFAGAGEPRSLEEKIEDIGLLHALTRSANAISLHIPWDIPSNPENIKSLAKENGLRFDAMNSNTFQDQPEQRLSYKFGSMQHVNRAVRNQAIEHNIEVIKFGKELGSKSLTVWLSDGSSFPGQLNFRKAFQNTLESLQEVYSALPHDWKMFVEYKAFEPNFYSMTVADWGQSLLYTSKLGSNAYTLVDLCHHLANANIEQIVALLLMEGKLGGFHFNDSKYGDDGLTVGSIKPYQLFLIFNELVEGMDTKKMIHATDLAWMIDASHNVKDPLEDLLQSLEAINLAYAKALLVDRKKLVEAQNNNDVAAAQEIIQYAFNTDVRPLLAEARLRNGGAINPLSVYRSKKVRKQLINERDLRNCRMVG
ncbi:MAG: TIM barrel protein [Ginsengibacter sp.]